MTPDDIVNYPLKQAVRGYSVKQVDELLDQVADEMERLKQELQGARERLVEAERRVSGATETETTLKRTLLTAQRAAEQSLEEARERAAELVEEARREGAASLEQARLDAEQLRIEVLQAARAEEADMRRRRQELETRIEALRVFERDYRARLRAFVEGQLRALEETQVRPQQLDARATARDESGGLVASRWDTTEALREELRAPAAEPATPWPVSAETAAPEA